MLISDTISMHSGICIYKGREQFLSRKEWDMAIKKWESTLLGIKKVGLSLLKWDCPS